MDSGRASRLHAGLAEGVATRKGQRGLWTGSGLLLRPLLAALGRILAAARWRGSVQATDASTDRLELSSQRGKGALSASAAHVTAAALGCTCSCSMQTVQKRISSIHTDCLSSPPPPPPKPCVPSQGAECMGPSSPRHGSGAHAAEADEEQIVRLLSTSAAALGRPAACQTHSTAPHLGPSAFQMVIMACVISIALSL